MATQTAAHRWMLCAAGSIGVAAVTATTYWLYQRWSHTRIPEKWRRIGVLQQINLFPLKSGAPLTLSAADAVDINCDVLGLRVNGFRDRGLMLLDSENQMLTARVHPHMLLIHFKPLSTTKLLISAPEMENIELDFATLAAEGRPADVHTSVWGTKVDAMPCGVRYDKWFARFVLKDEAAGLRLVYYAFPHPVREVNARLTKEPYITRQDTGTFNDATSYMLMNLASIDDLNKRIERPVDPLQFRGNFHLKMDNDEPYAEDNWGWVRIGEGNIFRVVAPCTRCILPNIDPVTAKRDPDGEPLKTLKSYRRSGKFAKYGGSPALGIHLGLRQGQGTIKPNDIIYVEDV